MIGHPLDDCYAQSQPYLDFVRGTDPDQANSLAVSQQAILNLQGKTAHLASFSSVQCNEEVLVERHRLSGAAAASRHIPPRRPAMVACALGHPRPSWVVHDCRLLQRVFTLDLETCPRCQRGTLRLIAAITQAGVIRKILRHLQRAADPPPIAPARSCQASFAWASP